MFIILRPPPAVLAAIAVLTAIAVNGGESVTSLIFELEKDSFGNLTSNISVLGGHF